MLGGRVALQARSRVRRDGGEQARNGCEADQFRAARRAVRQVCLNLEALLMVGSAKYVHAK